MKIQQATQSESDTVKLAGRLASVCEQPCVLFLEGPLGAGKTAFARGFIHARGYEGPVPSPSYQLVQIYEGEGLPIVHMDLYRMESASHFEDLGMLEWVDEAIWLVEWPEQGAKPWLSPDYQCRFLLEPEGRSVLIEANSGLGEKGLQALGACD